MGAPTRSGQTWSVVASSRQREPAADGVKLGGLVGDQLGVRGIEHFDFRFEGCDEDGLTTADQLRHATADKLEPFGGVIDPTDDPLGVAYDYPCTGTRDRLPARVLVVR